MTENHDIHELVTQTSKAEREAVQALQRLSVAFREQGSKYQGPMRARLMARAEATLQASETIHWHQAERIVTRKTSPKLKAD